jgi:DNA-directed RNA polymerase subunit RPC12/RpoP
MTQNPNETPIALKCPQCGASLFPGKVDYIVCRYCGSSLVYQRPDVSAESANQAPSPNSQPSAQVVKGYKLRLLTVQDHEGTGLEVFRMLVPEGWQFQGGVRWLLDNPSMPATLACLVANPQGPEAFEVLPNLNFTWRSGGIPILGGKLFGAEVHQPVAIRDAFRSFVLPRYRSAPKDVRILKEEVLPDLPRMARSEAAISPIGRAEGGRVRVTYTWSGWQLEEEIYGVVEAFRVPVQTLFSSMEVTTWFIDYLFSFRSAAGKLDSLADLFGVMIRSLKTNPEWYAAFKSVAQYLAQAQIQRIHNIGQIGQIYAQTGSQIRSQNLNDYYARQATYDRLATDWSRAIRDVDAFYDPNRGETVELPAGYGHAWANNLGEYIVTDSADYNPNIGSNLNWSEMEPK